MIYSTRCLPLNPARKGGLWMQDFSYSVLAGVVACLIWHIIQKWLD